MPPLIYINKPACDAQEYYLCRQHSFKRMPRNAVRVGSSLVFEKLTIFICRNFLHAVCHECICRLKHILRHMPAVEFYSAIWVFKKSLFPSKDRWQNIPETGVALLCSHIPLLLYQGILYSANVISAQQYPPFFPWLRSPGILAV